MSGGDLKKVVIEVTYYNKSDAMELLKKVNRNNLADSDFRRFGGATFKKDCINLSREPKVKEPEIREVNGKKCLIIQSKLNYE